MNYESIQQKFEETVMSDTDLYIRDYKELLKRVEKSSARYKGETVPFIYNPYFVSEEDIKNYEYIADTAMKISDMVSEKFIKDENFRKKFPFDERLTELIMHEPLCDVYVPLARYDIFYKNRDEFKFCELNTDGSSAMNEDNEVAKIYMNARILKDMDMYFSYFELFYSLRNEFLDIYEKKMKRKPENVFIVDLEESQSKEEFLRFKEVFEEADLDCYIADPRKFIRKDGALYYDDIKVDAVYRRLVTFEAMDHYDEIKDFIDSYLNDEIFVIGSFRSQIMHNKIIFKILHDEDFLSQIDRQYVSFIEKHVPYTAVLDDEGFLKVLKDKDRYIIKPYDNNASKGVYAGRDFSFEDFKKILSENKNKNYIYQEYIEPYKRDIVLFEDEKAVIRKLSSIAGLFIYNKKFKGLYTRFGEKSIISSLSQYYLGLNIYAKERI